MDVQLQELIDKIKKDGVASAESAAAVIISDAEKKAAAIVSDAENKAAGIIKNAKAETERMEKASVDAIRQAGRNLLIAFRDGVTSELSSIITDETTNVMTSDMLKTLVPETIKAWTKNTDASSVSVLLATKDLEKLESGFKTSLKEELSKGLEIKADKSVGAGFRIGSKDGAAYYDFSAEAVAAMFAVYLNPKTAQIMKDAAAEGIK